MPAKPAWYRNLDYIIGELQASSRPFVDRPSVERLLNVKRRRAQQIMAPCISERVGSSGLADRDALIARLRRLASGEQAYYEVNRLRKVVGVIAQLRKERLEQPQLLVEAPPAVARQELCDLPVGVSVSAGRITVEFQAPAEALEKLLALAMAIGNDFDAFERMATTADPATPASSRVDLGVPTEPV